MYSRAQLYKLLTERPYIEQDRPDPEDDYYTRRPDAYWPIISERKEVSIVLDNPDSSDAYYNCLSRSQAEANDYQVRMTADTVMGNRREYRHFFVVHTEPDKVNWKIRWQHLDKVMTIEECIEELEKPSAKGNLIDFWSWRFPPKPTPQTSPVASPDAPGMEESNSAGTLMVFSESEG